MTLRSIIEATAEKHGIPSQVWLAHGEGRMIPVRVRARDEAITTAHRELGMNMSELAEKFCMDRSSISMAIRRHKLPSQLQVLSNIELTARVLELKRLVDELR